MTASDRSLRLTLGVAVLLLAHLIHSCHSQLTHGDGELDCKDSLNCTGQSVVIEQNSNFFIDCDAQDACQDTQFTIQPGCTLTSFISCAIENSCQRAMFKVYESDLSDFELGCGSDSDNQHQCKGMKIHLFNNSKVWLLCGYDSHGQCDSLEVHAQDTSEIIISDRTLGSNFTVYLYDQATVVDNGISFNLVSLSPTANPTGNPTSVTVSPTPIPTNGPTTSPSAHPTIDTHSPTFATSMPSQIPTQETLPPTLSPTQAAPQPSLSPTSNPVFTDAPTSGPILANGNTTNRPSGDATPAPIPNESEDEGDRSGGNGNDSGDVLIGLMVGMAVLIVCLVIVFVICNRRMNQEMEAKEEEIRDKQLKRVTSLSSVNVNGEDLEEKPQLEIVPIGGEFVEDPKMEQGVKNPERGNEGGPIQFEFEGNHNKTRGIRMKLVEEEDEHELMYEKVSEEGAGTISTTHVSNAGTVSAEGTSDEATKRKLGTLVKIENPLRF